MSQQQPTSTGGINPIESLHANLNKEILIKVKRNRVFKGILKSYDAHLNILLENCIYKFTIEEPQGTSVEKEEKYRSIIIRGDNIVYVGLAGK